MRLGLRDRQDLTYLWLEMRRTLEVLEPDGLADQRPRNGILNAEFSLQRSIRQRVVGVSQTTAVRKDLDFRYILGSDAFLIDEPQHHGDRGMSASATRKLLEAIGGAFNLQWPPPIIQHQVGVEGSGAVEDIQKALMMLKDRGIGVEAPLGKQGCEESVACAVGKFVASV